MRNRQSPDGDDVTLKSASFSTSFLQNMVDAAQQVLCAIDEEGYFTFVSKACLKFWGYNPQDMAGTAWQAFVVKDDVAKTHACLQQSKKTNTPVNFSNRFYTSEGSVISMQWSGSWNNGDQLYYFTIAEGTRVSQIEERLEKAQKMANVAGFEFDLVHEVYTYASDTLFTIFGIDREKHPVFTKNMFWAAIHPDDLQFVKESMLLPDHLYKAELDYRIVRPDGDVVYIRRLREVVRDASGNPLKTIGTIQDITDRKLSELALMQSSQRFKALVENGSDLISIVDAEGNYMFVADSVKQILGYDSSYFIGRNAFAYIHPDDQPVVYQGLLAVTSQKYVTLKPFRFKNACGDWIWIESRIADFTNDPVINGLIINSRDITEKKKGEDKIRELSLIAEKTSQAILLSDSQHHITWANQAFTNLSEYTKEEVVGKKPQEIFCSGNKSVAENVRIQSLLEQHQTVLTEMFCNSKTGKQYWLELQIQPIFNEDGALVQYLAIGKDITERKVVDAQLILSEQKFKALVQNGSDLIVIIDENGFFKYVSENVSLLLDYNPQGMIGKNAFDFVHNDDLEVVKGELQKVLSNNHESRGVQHRFLAANGDWIWLESKGANHLDNNSINGIIINARNINDRVKLQNQLNKELRSRQKELTTAVINAQEQERSQLGLELHDNVNQVLTTVKLYNEMFLSGYEQDKELIRKSTVYLQDCINEIRSISKRLSAPTLGHISLQDSIQELIDSLVVTKQVEILFRPYSIEQLCISRELHLTIYRIVQEGLNNIIKYAEAQTAIIAIRHWEDTLTLTIYDDGKGFDTKLKRSGIGITNMRSRAENMNGNFVLNSTPGNGCIIKIVFPFTANTLHVKGSA